MERKSDVSVAPLQYMQLFFMALNTCLEDGQLDEEED